jgi:hypothetical protein
MGLQISECSTVAEYQTRIGSENGGDYIYVNKFNHSLIFSDNGSRAVMSEPVIQEDGISWYVDLNSTETASSRVGSSTHPFATINELLYFLPKNTNGHLIDLYITASSEDQDITFDGFENLRIHGLNNTTDVPVFSFNNCKNITVYATDTETASEATDCKIGTITNSTVTIAGGTTYDGIINVAGPITNSTLTPADAEVIINTTSEASGPVYFDVKAHSVVELASVTSSAVKTIRVDDSEFTAKSVIYCNITATDNSNVRIETLYRAKASSKETAISVDNLSNVAVTAYAFETGVEDSTYRDALVVTASNGSRVSIVSKTSELVPVKSVTAQTGSYVTITTLTGYLINNSGRDEIVNPALQAHMASTIMYYKANIDASHEITPTETVDTMGQINTADSTVDLSNYVQYNASTVSA